MGGKAFSHLSPPLLTPRLPPPLYFSLRTYYTALLSTLFAHVSSPPPLPSKADHGDIDFLVVSPIPSLVKQLASIPSTSPSPANKFNAPAVDPTTKALLALLKPQATIKSGGKTRSYAVPHPEKEVCFVQLDVRICADTDEWKWNVFLTAYGDLWLLWGKMIRGFGLVATDKGLWARNMAMEEAGAGKEKSRLLLTRDVREVVLFLGYEEEDWERYWGEGVFGDGDGAENGQCDGDNNSMEAPDAEKTVPSPCLPSISNTGSNSASNPDISPATFPSLEAFFAFAIKCRFFRKSIFKPHSPPRSENNDPPNPPPSGEEPARKAKKKPHKTKTSGLHSDTYRLLVDSFIPSLPDADATDPAPSPSKLSTSSSPPPSDNKSLTTDDKSSPHDSATPTPLSNPEAKEKALRKTERSAVLDEALTLFSKHSAWEDMQRRWGEEKRPWGDKAVANALREEYWRGMNEYADGWIEEVGRGREGGEKGDGGGKRKRTGGGKRKGW